MSLQTLAEMIAQSRLENGAHFPTDITAGRFLGEAAHDYYLEKMKTQSSKKSNQESLSKMLRKSALELRKDSGEEKALQLYASDLSEFLSTSLIFGLVNDWDITFDGYKIPIIISEISKNFLWV